MPRKRIPHEVDTAAIEENAQSPEMATFAKTLNSLLVEKNVHQDDMAQALGISTGSISSWRNGKKEPRLSMIIKVADYLGVDCHYLMTGIQAENYVCSDELGLSSNSVKFLKQQKNLNPLYWRMDTINFLIESEYFPVLLDMIIGFATSTDKEIQSGLVSNNSRPIVTDKDVFRAKAADLLTWILSASKDCFAEKTDYRSYYRLYRGLFTQGASINDIRKEMEENGLVFDEKMFEGD